MASDDLFERVVEACHNDGRYVRLALQELGARFVEEIEDTEFLIARIRALYEEDIIHAG